MIDFEMAPLELGFTPGDAVIVTGAGSGIGRATALGAARCGLTVAAWDIDRAAVTETVDAIVAAGGNAVATVVDVGRDDAVAEGIDGLAPLGTPRHLVNNAGPAADRALAFDEAVSLCIGSMRRVTEAWLALSPGPGATVVNLSSIAGTTIATDSDWYVASKAGIAGYTRYLAVKRVDQCRANAVAPGIVDTPRIQDFARSPLGQGLLGRVPLGRMASPHEIANVILFLLAPLSSYVNGAVLVADGGTTLTQ